MKVSVHFANLNARASWQRMIEAELRRLESLGEIVSARARVERHHDERPAFRVAAFLEVPGPDFHAEAADHTLPAAVLKLVGILGRQIKNRKRQQIVRHKAHGRLRAPVVHSSAMAGARP